MTPTYRTYHPGECFVLTEEAIGIYGQHLAGLVFTVKASHGSAYIAHQKALRTAVADFEMIPHPGPATTEANTPKPRRKPRTHDYRTPAQRAQAEIYAAIRAHKLNPQDAVDILTESAESIRSQLFKGKAVHHIDGNVYNNDLDNLRVVDIKENA